MSLEIDLNRGIIRIIKDGKNEYRIKETDPGEEDYDDPWRYRS